MEKINSEALENVAGGRGSSSWKKEYADVAPGTFLALRTDASANDGNIIDQIQPGEIFKVSKEEFNGDYLWASVHGLQGWVNGNYVVDAY